jgi:site-specific DNA-methyltransferase (adenine-specific)
MGSGTTAIACRELNRKFIGMEKEQKYVDMANERLKEFDMQGRLL